MKTVTIVGGGLAGLTLGIALRQRNVPVVVLEAGHYPRYRVCGEFISGKGQRTLERLGLLPLLREAGVRPARTVAFFLATKSFPIQILPQPGLCMSRFVLDALLAEKFRALGGELRCGIRWQIRELGEGLVRATGRRVKAVENGCRWFGLKAHATRVSSLTADLELHFSTNSYVGLCRLGDGTVNVCGLFRQSKEETYQRQNWIERLRGEPGSVLRHRLDKATWNKESFCSVAGLSLRPRRAAVSSDCCIGDALTMIAPVTGNGMSIAFESAEMALDPVTAYALGSVEWNEARRRVAVACDRTFARRLKWGRLIERILFCPLASHVILAVASRTFLWRFFFEATR